MSRQSQWLFEAPRALEPLISTVDDRLPKLETEFAAAYEAEFKQQKPIVIPPVVICGGRPFRVLDQFKFDRFSLNLNQQQIIREIATQIVASQGKPNQINTVCLEGHTDTTGQEGYNVRLGQKRAETTRQALTKELNRLSPGLAKRITIFSQSSGESSPVLDSQGREDASRSRRVEIFLNRTRIPSPLEQKVEEILNYIRSEAQKAALRSRTVAGSNFARIVSLRYLSRYLASPSPTTATAAIDAISRQNTSGIVTKVCRSNDFWEANTPAFNGTAIPPAIRRIPGFSRLPAKFGAATEILTVANRRTLSHIDVPFLLGRRTLDPLDCSTAFNRGRDPDLQANNGINESQLMHWATGVKYSQLNRDLLRELFIAYELWHLELWDVFGHDPINDLIAEDAARHMAQQIRTLRMNRSNFISILDQGFLQARAWVGAMLRLRRNDLDRQIRADKPPSAFIHWTQEVLPTSPDHPYRSPSIRQMLASGQSTSKVKASKLVSNYIQVYTLLFEADLWERTNGQVPLSLLQQKMGSGALNLVFRSLSALERSGRPSSIATRKK
jgi:outer membrane protein OmpA-like peptidoglycan-associated protein